MLIAQVQTVAQAREAVAQGAQIVVAQGTEAGGHTGMRATLPLVPAVKLVARAKTESRRAHALLMHEH